MPGDVCKAAICRNKAQNQLESGCQNLEDFKGESEDFQIFASETYIKYVSKAEAVILEKIAQEDALVMESGQ